jgi:glycosyltransferase involved in cell wall biosynthesis
MEYPVTQAGGVEALVVELVRGLTSEFSIVLVSDDDADSVAAAGLAPLLAEHFPWRSGQGGAAEAESLAVALKQAGVALAHFHFGGTYGWNSRTAHKCPIPATARLGIPVVITNHWVQPPLEGYCRASRPLWFKLAMFPFAWCSRLRVLHSARLELTVSIHNRNVVRDSFWPLRSKIGHMYHSSLDEHEPEPALRAEDRPPVILEVATIARRKGQRVLIEAFDCLAARYPEWTLRLVGYVGDKDYFEEIRTMDATRRLGDRLEFTGPLSRTETAEAMFGAAIFVLPSLSEGLPLSVQEAVFRGCACVATSVSGIPELIEHGRTGLLVPPNDVTATAEALDQLITDRALRRQLARRGRASIIAKGMTRQGMLRRHVELYRSLLAQKGSATADGNEDR